MIDIVRASLFATLLASIVSSSFADEKQLRLEHRLSQDTCFFISAKNVTDLKTRLTASSLGRLLNDPAVKDAKQQVLAFIEQSLKESDLPDGISLHDLLSIPSGEVTVAILKPKDKSVPVVFSMEFGDSKKVVDQIIDEVKEIRDGNRYEKLTHAGVDLHVVHRKVAGQPKASVFFVDGSTIVITNSIDLSKTLVDRWAGTATNSLANAAVFQHVQQQTLNAGKTPSVFWYLDLNLLLSGLLDGSTDPSKQLVIDNLPKLGLHQLRAIGGSIEISTTKYDVISRVVGYVDQPTNGLLSFFRLKDSKLELPAWAPKGVDGVAAINLDLESAYNSGRELTDAFTGKGNFDKGIRMLATDSKGPLLHIKLDVIDQLSGRVYIIQEPAKLVDGELEDGATLLAAEVLEEVKARQILAKQLNNNEEFRARDFRGTKIYTSNDKELGANIAIVHGCVMITDGPQLLEATIAVENAAAGFIAKKSLQRLIKEMPQGASMLTIQESAQQVGVVYNYLRELAATAPDVKIDKLPEFDQLKHYLLPSIGYTVPTKNGFKHTSFSLQPDGE